MSDLYDIDRLKDSYAHTIHTLSKPSHHTPAHHGYRQTRHLDAFAWLLDDYQPIHTAWISVIYPGGYVVPHVDAGPYRERWQIPIQTAGTITVAGIELEQTPGVPFQVEHWHPHRVDNPTDRARIHLVIDRDIIVNPATPGFEIIG